MGGGEGVFEDGLAAFVDDVVQRESFILMCHEMRDPFGAPADVHGFVDDVVENSFGGGVVVELDVVLVGLVFEGEGVLFDDVSENGVTTHRVVKLAPSIVAHELGEFVNLVAEFANAFLAHFAVAAFVVTVAGDVVVEFPVHVFDFPKDGAESFGGLHLHGVGDELPEGVGFFIVDGWTFEAVELDLEAGVAFRFAEGEEGGVSGRGRGKFDG